MVWGMSRVPGSNGFYLEGDLEGPREMASSGWRERLKDHFRKEMPEEQKQLFEDGHQSGAHWYACHTVGRFLNDRGCVTNPGEKLITQIADHEVPRYFQVAERIQNAPASLAILSGGVMVVIKALKEFIEWVEPSTHQFFPIEIRIPSGKIRPESYYIMVIGQWIDSFSPEMSAKSSFEKFASGVYSYSERPKDLRALAFRRRALSEAHLWREPRLEGSLICFSDRLQAEIIDAGLRIPRHYRMIEV